METNPGSDLTLSDVDMMLLNPTANIIDFRYSVLMLGQDIHL